MEIFFTREVADEWAGGGAANVKVQDVEFDGIRVATSWNALFRGVPLVGNATEGLQTIKYGNANCGGLGNTDL